METNNGCTVFALLSAIAGGLFGFFIRFVLAKKSAKRKEDWDLLKELTEHINTLVSEAVSFYCTKDTDAETRRKKGIQIQRMIREAAQKVQFLSQSLGNKSIDGYMKRLRQALTQEDFDADVTREPLNPKDEKIIAIEREGDAFIGAINRGRVPNFV